MNIFVVEWGIIESARSLFDTHVVKMPTEAMQLLSVAARFYFPEEDPVRSYRNLYRYDKLPNLPRAAYTRRTPPDWLQHPEHGRWVVSPTGDCYVYRSD